MSRSWICRYPTCSGRKVLSLRVFTVADGVAQRHATHPEIRLLSVAYATAIDLDVTSDRWPAADTSGVMSSRDVLAWFREELVVRAVEVAHGDLVASPLVRQAATFIDEHHAEPLTLHALASAVGYSARHVETRFRRETGRTVHSHLAHVRVRNALALILRGEKIEAVSWMVGYKSKKNFYYQFKKIVGVTPHTYRTRILRLRSIDST